jgi:hypothetical protein
MLTLKVISFWIIIFLIIIFLFNDDVIDGYWNWNDEKDD